MTILLRNIRRGPFKLARFVVAMFVLGMLILLAGW